MMMQLEAQLEKHQNGGDLATHKKNLDDAHAALPGHQKKYDEASKCASVLQSVHDFSCMSPSSQDSLQMHARHLGIGIAASLHGQAAAIGYGEERALSSRVET